MKFNSDIDIDFADRQRVLSVIQHVPASMINKSGQRVQHNTGVYVTEMPQDPFTGMASVDYMSAESRGYIKLDMLNVTLYQQVRDEKHLELLTSTPPDWDRFNTDQAFFEQLIHVNNHWRLLKQMPEPVDSIARLSMFLAVIRPAKRNLAGLSWREVSGSVWEKDAEGYQFKKSHAVAYAHLVVVNMNLLRH
jgi:hypothetical protein